MIHQNQLFEIIVDTNKIISQYQHELDYYG
jgi:hypothetical protein